MPHKNIEIRRKYMRERMRLPEHKEKAAIRQRSSHGRKLQKFNRIRSIYGMSRDDYLSMFGKTEGKCPICFTYFIEEPRKGASAVIDHDHVTNKVRGIICHNCNVLIGNAKDSSEILERAAKYLSHALSKP